MILIASKADIIQLVNPIVMEMFGYEEWEWVESSTEMLVPMAAKGRHEMQRDSYHKNPCASLMSIIFTLKVKKRRYTSH